MNYFKKVETIVIMVVILVLGVAYGLLSNNATAPSNSENVAQEDQKQGEVAAVLTVQYPGEDGKNALELLKSKYKVETQSFGDMGEFVRSINEIEPGGTHFWALYVNGQQSQIGADQYVTRSTDVIEWKLEEIK